MVAGAVPADWIESLTTPPDCRVTYILFDALFTFGKNEVEAFGMCGDLLWGDTTAFFEPFDHVGTYTNGYATVTISEVPDLAGSAALLLFSLGALVLYRRPRIRHQWMV